MNYRVISVYKNVTVSYESVSVFVHGYIYYLCFVHSYNYVAYVRMVVTSHLFFFGVEPDYEASLRLTHTEITKQYSTPIS